VKVAQMAARSVEQKVACLVEVKVVQTVENWAE